MLCHWLRINQGDNRLIEFGEHEIVPHQVEASPQRAAAKLVLGQVVNFPVEDAAGLQVIKRALDYRGVKVKGLESY